MKMCVGRARGGEAEAGLPGKALEWGSRWIGRGGGEPWAPEKKPAAAAPAPPTMGDVAALLSAEPGRMSNRRICTGGRAAECARAREQPLRVHVSMWLAT
jgi:hypothetical protein